MDGDDMSIDSYFPWLQMGKFVLRAVMVATVLAGSLALVHPTRKNLKVLADRIHLEKAMREERSVHWGMNLTTTEIIEAMGYPTEIHHVTTADGYILELHRIPHGINSTGGDRPVALLQHCLLCSSADYIMNTPDQALAYVLADAGYDVWLPNFRGNTYSTNHVELDPANIKFWGFR
ncbi:Gastric triacylglycerol lipase [Portunus trituberculatus]|uniref:Gastric triacylglycerol lipase n=1 Tax=Portunus trituberculatus TaxID=210409 RepID=A0A5B7E036_PORTR|nr:Gastric triacylglycerol lipase [Portunus trituberculatus]